MGLFKWMEEAGVDWVRYTGGGWSHPEARMAERFDDIKNELERHAHEELHLFYDAATGGRFAVSIHSTRRGPSIGGFRLFNYPDEHEALRDAMRLGRGMTLKSAAVGLPLGGGKAVCWLDSVKYGAEREALLRAFARFLTKLEGRYVTAEDVGTTVEDMDLLDEAAQRYSALPLVVCRSAKVGGGGNPSPFTAVGVLEAMRIACEEVYGEASLEGRSVALQGLGNVGAALAGMLLNEGASLQLSDVNMEKLHHVLDDPRCVERCEMVPRQELHTAACDIFSPCALGAVLNDRTIPQLGCRIVAGSANNQLEDDERDGALLAGRGILYVPDFIINSGGIINAYVEYRARVSAEPYKSEATEAKIAEIFSNLKHLFKRARETGRDTNSVALELARERLKG